MEFGGGYMKIFQKNRDYLFLFFLIIFGVMTFSYSLIIGGQNKIKEQQNVIESKEKQKEQKYILSQQDKELGVAEITFRKEYPDYIMPSMVKLIPRETTLGVKKGEGISLKSHFTFIFPYAPRGGSDTTRTVKLDPYWIGQYEVTLYEFEKFLNDTEKAKKDILIDGENQVKPNRPVVGIYRKDAIEYCEWLSKKTGMKFRLPTEDEWEYSARSGYEQKPTPYGDEMPFEYYDYQKYSNYIQEIVHKEIGYEPYKNFNWEIIYQLIHDFGSFPETLYHLYDMGGNVKEWTYHDYAPDIYRIKDVYKTVYDRIIEKKDIALIDLGFRLVRDVKDIDPKKETINKDSEKSFH